MNGRSLAVGEGRRANERLSLGGGGMQREEEETRTAQAAGCAWRRYRFTPEAGVGGVCGVG